MLMNNLNEFLSKINFVSLHFRYSNHEYFFHWTKTKRNKNLIDIWSFDWLRLVWLFQFWFIFRKLMMLYITIISSSSRNKQGSLMILYVRCQKSKIKKPEKNESKKTLLKFKNKFFNFNFLFPNLTSKCLFSFNSNHTKINLMMMIMIYKLTRSDILVNLDIVICEWSIIIWWWSLLIRIFFTLSNFINIKKWPFFSCN